VNQLVPLQSIPNQSFAVNLTVNGAPLVLQLGLNYDSIKGYWDMVVMDTSGTVLIDSVPLTTGEYPAANLFAQYQYMELGSAYLLNTGGAASDYPTANNLEAFSLVWGDNVQ
jgi:hypothetical protein